MPDRPPTVQIETVAAPSVNHAMAHNGLRFLHRLVINLTGTDLPIIQVGVDVQLVDADGTVISRPWARAIETLEPGQPVAFDSPAITLDPQYLSSLDERTTAEIVSTVRTATGVLGRSHLPIAVLAARQWLMEPQAPVRSLELLAAFVQPNHPSVAVIVAETARMLEQTTRSGSLAVEHVLPERIDEIVAAVFEAVRRREIFYAAPPAGWGTGQKVRTPADVLEDRLGTCLDLTLVLAAVLEQIGINPVIWVARGHAFLGYWRRRGYGLPDAASEQIASAANAVDLKLMGVVEATMVTRERRPPQDVFRRASQAPLDGYFLGGSAELLGTVDVGMARMLNVLPLPARHRRADGVVEVVEYRPAERIDPMPQPTGATTGPDVRAEPSRARSARVPAAPPPPRVHTWKNSLLDLTLRNRLLNLGHGVTQLGLLVPSEQLGAIADLLQDDRSISVRALDDLTGAVTGQQAGDAYGLPGDVQRAMLQQRSTIYSSVPGTRHKDAMQRLRSRARTTLQETGANPLALTLGRLDWQLGDRRLSAPLLVAPVEIRGVVQPFKIDFDPTGQISLNLSLMEKLRMEFGFTVPGLDGELPTRADGGVDVDAVIMMVRQAIAAAELEFRVESEARLAILSFTGYLLWRDLDEHWESFVDRPLVRHLVSTPTEGFGSGRTDHDEPPPEQRSEVDLDEIVAVLPIPADGSQAEAIAAARAGQSFVLEGPPGTGKSQTITNILADQMAHGRTVLFVAEKGAALDVVRARLGQVGLLPFTLDLHDHNARPSEVRARIKSALGQQPAADTVGHQVVWSDTRSSARALAGYAERVHARNGAGLSLYSARAHQLARGAGEVLPVDARLVGAPAEEVSAVRRAVEDAEPLLAELDPTDWSAWGFVGTPAATFDPDQTADAVEPADVAAAEAIDALGLCSHQAEGLVRTARTVRELADLVWLLSPALPDGDAFAELGTTRLRAHRAELLRRLDQLTDQSQQIRRRFVPTVLTVPIKPVRQAVREASASFFLGRKGRVVRAAGPVLGHLRPGEQVSPTEVPQLVDEVAALAAQAGGLVDDWRMMPGCRHLPASLNLLDDCDLARLRAAAAQVERAEDLLAAMPPTRRSAVVTVRRSEAAMDVQPARAVERAVHELTTVFAVSGAQETDQWWYAGEAGLLQRWVDGVAARRTDRPMLYRLQHWTRTVGTLEPLRTTAPDARWLLLTTQLGRTQAAAALDRGLATTAVAERLAAGGFASFDPATQDRTVDRFVAASARLRESLRTALPTEILANRPFSPGGFFGKVAALEREANRSRGGLSVRQLMVQFGEVVTAVTPCVLVSPDSLARFIPPGAVQFDLVVFDEASQIRVADAVGAVGRAKAFVVAGDSKQMPPWTFGELAEPEPVTLSTRDLNGAERAEDEAAAEDYWVVPDEESVLSECVSAGVTRRWLSWHYRSRDETLITFSNAQYYDNRLSTFPAVPGQLHDTGLSFVRVDGRFIRSARAAEPSPDPEAIVPDAASDERRRLLRTNPVEATTVVAEVLRRWRTGERSIGVVTFNIQQRNLIEQLLWDCGVEGVAESLVAREGEGLFIKNLENVQGDERDVILFSTGFSANESGVLPLNFGPLNRRGGERRLNVAITRARRRIMVFSSFEPEDLRTEQTSSVGLKHLRAYLELAKYGVGAAPVPADPELPSGAVTRTVSVDRHRDELAEALRSRGIEVQTSVGLSDFRVDLALTPPGSGAPAMAVLLDSPEWAARRTTGDRDGLPTTVLSAMMGWPRVARVWLPDWLRDPDRVLDRLTIELDQAAQTERTSGETLVRSHWEQFDPEQVHAVLDQGEDPDPARAADGPAGQPPVVEESFVWFEHTTRGSRSTLDQATTGSSAERRVQKLITEVVQTEGPISVERLARVVIDGFGISRLVDTRMQQIRSLVPKQLRRDPEDGFVWPRSRDPLRWDSFRRTPEGRLADRTLDDVASRELANAAAYVVRTSMGIATDELDKELIKIFGGNRVTPTVRARLALGVETAVRLGQLRRSGTLLVPGDGRTQTQGG